MAGNGRVAPDRRTCYERIVNGDMTSRNASDTVISPISVQSIPSSPVGLAGRSVFILVSSQKRKEEDARKHNRVILMNPDCDRATKVHPKGPKGDI